jgi:hypothetical protein
VVVVVVAGDVVHRQLLVPVAVLAVVARTHNGFSKRLI